MTTSLKTESSWVWIHRVLMPILIVILTGTVSVGGFISSKIWDRVENGLVNLDVRLDVIEVNQARTDGNRFTSQHWTDAKARIDEDRAIIDRRVTRLEESSQAIKETLARIENKLDKIQSNP